MLYCSEAPLLTISLLPRAGECSPKERMRACESQAAPSLAIARALTPALSRKREREQVRR
jgi:hypothetical protein